MNDFELQLRELRGEVASLRAHEAIRQRIHAYSRALDRLDRALLLAQFWPEAQLDYGVFYRGEISGFLDIALDFQRSMRDTHHLVGNISASIDGDRASAESYVHAHHILLQGDELVRLQVGARYLDRFEQRDGEWRLSYRTELIDWGQWLPEAGRWFERAIPASKLVVYPGVGHIPMEEAAQASLSDLRSWLAAIPRPPAPAPR